MKVLSGGSFVLPKPRFSFSVSNMKKIAAHWQILIAIGLAVVVGSTLKNIVESVDGESVYWVDRTIEICKLAGDLFINALKMIIVPLIVSSIIAGIASLSGFDGFKRLGMKTISFYLLTTLSAVVLGLFIVNTMKPGMVEGKPNAELQEVFKEQQEANKDIAGRFTDEKQEGAKDWKNIFLRMFPSNIVKAGTDNGSLLGLLVFSLLFGIAMTQLPKDSMAPLYGFFQGLNDVMIRITQWIMACAPIGIFGLLTATIFNTGLDIFEHMWLYFITVLIALALHLFCVLPLILKFVGKINPIHHFKSMRNALLTAFSTASSSATLPVTMRCVQDNAGVSKKTASFTLPLGATVNMDGTALYECIAVVFVSQVMGFEMDFAAQMLVVISALLTSIGVAGVPSASLVAILIIMNNAAIPGADVAIFALFAVDRLLDMSRTAVNVFGDSCAAAVVAKSEGEELYAKYK